MDIQYLGVEKIVKHRNPEYDYRYKKFLFNGIVFYRREKVLRDGKFVTSRSYSREIDCERWEPLYNVFMKSLVRDF